MKVELKFMFLLGITVLKMGGKWREKFAGPVWHIAAVIFRSTFKGVYTYRITEILINIFKRFPIILFDD